MFTATREIQDWFTNCAKLVAKIRCRPINWVTPLGLPVVQPYFVPVKKTYVNNTFYKFEAILALHIVLVIINASKFQFRS